MKDLFTFPGDHGRLPAPSHFRGRIFWVHSPVFLVELGGKQFTKTCATLRLPYETNTAELKIKHLEELHPGDVALFVYKEFLKLSEGDYPGQEKIRDGPESPRPIIRYVSLEVIHG